MFIIELFAKQQTTLLSPNTSGWKASLNLEDEKRHHFVTIAAFQAIDRDKNYLLSHEEMSDFADICRRYILKSSYENEKSGIFANAQPQLMRLGFPVQFMSSVF